MREWRMFRGGWAGTGASGRGGGGLNALFPPGSMSGLSEGKSGLRVLPAQRNSPVPFRHLKSRVCVREGKSPFHVLPLSDSSRLEGHLLGATSRTRVYAPGFVQLQRCPRLGLIAGRTFLPPVATRLHLVLRVGSYTCGSGGNEVSSNLVGVGRGRAG